MIFADKIIKLRKRNGWSQEELAEKLNVSRQAVSKWEGAQSVPDIEKLLQLSSVFGVTTNYLLKDEIEDEEFLPDSTSQSVRKISLSDAQAYLKWRISASYRIAVATLLCILSPIALFILGTLSEVDGAQISENVAGAAGLILLFIAVAVAVAIFVHCGFKNSPYEFLDSGEAFECEYGVKGMVREKKEAYRSRYIRLNIIATCLCVLSPVALFVGAFSENEMLMVIMLSLMLLIVSIGVFLYIVAGVRGASMDKLLREGEYSEHYTKHKKEKNKLVSAISTVYWGLATAVFLVWTVMAENSWQHSWIVWPVAGIFYGALMVFCNIFTDEKK